MDTGNALLLVAVAGIGLYAFNQSKKSAGAASGAEIERLMALNAATAQEVRKASQRTLGEKIGGVSETLLDRAFG